MNHNFLTLVTSMEIRLLKQVHRIECEEDINLRESITSFISVDTSSSFNLCQLGAIVS